MTEVFNEKECAFFEEIWIAEFVKNDYNAASGMEDDMFIDYKTWSEYNWIAMYKKHIPETLVFRGKSPTLVFHGGCLGCKSQIDHGVERCKGCTFFRFGQPGTIDLSYEE